MIGKTNCKAVKQSGEYINVRLLTNQSSHSDLNGISFTVEYGGQSKDYTWEGSEVTLFIPADTEYTVKFNEVNGYRTPESVTYVAVAENARDIEALYQTELQTVNVSSDSGSVSGFEVEIVKGDSSLPGGYTPVEYIESTGAQYIDTGFKMNQDTRVVMKVKATSISANAWAFEGRTSSSSASKGVFFYYSSNKLWNVDYNGSSGRKSISGVAATDMLNIDYDKNVCTINGVSVTHTAATFQSSYNLTLLAANTAGTVAGYLNAMLYSCQIYDNGTLVRDFVPAKNADGAAGLYDKANDVFYPSASTTAFVAGGELTETIATQTTATGTYKIPFGTAYTVTAGNVSGYDSPAILTRTASEKSYTANMVYTEAIIDLSMQDVHGNPIQQTTANCYVVKKAGDYKFPLVFGCALKNGNVNAASYTNNGGDYSHDFVDYKGKVISSPYIEDSAYIIEELNGGQLTISDTDGIIENIEIVDGSPCRYMKFTVTSVPSTGANAVISYLDGELEIAWSWHIWLWEDDLTPVEIINASKVKYNIMPVNLASKWDDTAKTKIKNWFYQFGRPTPLLCPAAYNSTNNHASYGALSFYVANTASNLHAGIKNPTYFHKYSASNYRNWFSTDSYKAWNLWDAACLSLGLNDNDVVKTVYDPCPIGFKMPNGNVFTGFTSDGYEALTPSEINAVGSFSNGWKLKRYSGDTVGVFFPASGYYTVNGSLDKVGSNGYAYLSPAGPNDGVFALELSAEELQPNSNLYRAYGCSVRPVEDGITDAYIQFTVGETVCVAEEGMTWFEWVNSGYNSIGASSIFRDTVETLSAGTYSNVIAIDGTSSPYMHILGQGAASAILVRIDEVITNNGLYELIELNVFAIS